LSQEGNNNDLLKKTLKTTVTLKQQQQQPPTATFLVPQNAPEIPIHSSASNNSCSMIELESSDDEDEEENADEIVIEDEKNEDEESGDDDDDDDEEEEECVVSSSDDDDNDDEENLIQLDEEDEELNEEALLQALTFPSTKDVIDIDEEDKDNTQLCADYVKDIYYYLNALEKKYRVSTTFLERKLVSAKMRSILIDWLIQVHMKFHLLNETLYLCVQVIDAYLEAMDVTKMQLQLVGVAAMFVACKYEEMYVPAIDDFVYMTDNTYTKSEIRQMEISILKTMNFMLCKPLPLQFLRRFSKAGRADPKQHTLAKYFMELSLHDAEFASFDPSYLAACSLCLSFKLLDGPAWSRQLEFYSTYKLSALVSGMQKVARLVLKAQESDYKYKAATNKYSASKFMRISLLPELSAAFIKGLALNGTF